MAKYKNLTATPIHLWTTNSELAILRPYGAISDANPDMHSKMVIAACGANVLDIGEPVPVEPPTITGIAQVGETLTTTLGEWGFDAVVRISWQRGMNDSWVDITSTSADTYTIQDEDIGLMIRTKIRVSGAGEDFYAYSDPGGPVE